MRREGAGCQFGDRNSGAGEGKQRVQRDNKQREEREKKDRKKVKRKREREKKD